MLESFKVCGLTRKVTIQKSHYTKTEQMPLCDGQVLTLQDELSRNLYNKVKDPKLIGK